MSPVVKMDKGEIKTEKKGGGGGGSRGTKYTFDVDDKTEAFVEGLIMEAVDENGDPTQAFSVPFDKGCEIVGGNKDLFKGADGKPLAGKDLEKMRDNVAYYCTSYLDGLNPNRASVVDGVVVRSFHVSYKRGMNAGKPDLTKDRMKFFLANRTNNDKHNTLKRFKARDHKLPAKAPAKAPAKTT